MNDRELGYWTFKDSWRCWFDMRSALIAAFSSAKSAQYLLELRGLRLELLDPLEIGRLHAAEPRLPLVASGLPVLVFAIRLDDWRPVVRQ